MPGDDKAIITESDKVVKTLNSLVQEMENRYMVLEEVKLRKVEDYNELWRRELRDVRDEHGDKKYHYMPYIVAIIDEFSDMIMAAGKEVETPIVRIAQKARAVGIHMIIATQRPSATVITGNIRANFPGRIAFAVASSVDSRIILDATGAQRLIGRGDMLLSDDNGITRLQCPFVDTPDIVRISEFIKEQEDNDRDIAHEQCYQLPEYVSGDDAGGGSADASGIKDRDPGSNGIVLGSCQHNAEVIVFIDMMQHRLYLAVGTFRQHIKEIGKKVDRVICLFPDRHCQANRLAVVVLTISEHIFPSIRLLQYACLHIVNINFTLSHNQAA